MQALKTVLSDKKIWVAVVGLVAGIAIALGFDESLVATISGGVLSVVSVVLMAVMGVKDAKAAVTVSTPDALAPNQEPTQEESDK